jgi:hypothetical protein
LQIVFQELQQRLASASEFGELREHQPHPRWYYCGMTDPQKYRDAAERLRKKAVGIEDPDDRRGMLEIAALYERLAGQPAKAHEGSEKS